MQKILSSLLFFVSVSLTTYASPQLKLNQIFQAEDIVWGMDFLENQKMIFTLRSGKIGILDINSKKVNWVKHTIPTANIGQGGLLDVRVSLSFAKDSLVYFSHSISVDQKYTTAGSFGKLVTDPDGSYRLTDVTEFFRAIPASKETIHFGSRIDFGKSNELFLTSGERNERKEVQNLKSDLGKILKFNLVAGKPTQKQIYSYGHRNQQGLFYDANKNQLWSTEHGPRGGDELNLISENKNYGWPEYTNGREYYGLKIGKGPLGDGIEKSFVDWTPSIAPSALILYRSDRFPEFKDSFLVAVLKDQHVRQVKLTKDIPGEQVSLFNDQGLRFRSIRANSLGQVFLGTDSGQILEIVRM